MKARTKESPTLSRKPSSFRRSRVLKRGGVDLVPLSEDHFPYAWAAYRRGGFQGNALFPEDMDAVSFTARLANLAMEMIRQGNELVVGLAQKNEESIPVCLISIEYNGILAVPHGIWFPEATPRNKLELGLKFFMTVKKEHLVLTAVRETKGTKCVDVKFHEHLCHYGVIRRVGTIRDYYGAGENGILFQSVGK